MQERDENSKKYDEPKIKSKGIQDFIEKKEIQNEVLKRLITEINISSKVDNDKNPNKLYGK